MTGTSVSPRVSPTEGDPVPKDGPPEGGSVMRLPWGLIGFESLREATPLPLEGMEPFRWLRFEGDDPGARGFLVVDSRLIQPVFSLDLDADDCSSLGIADGADLQVWIVVSLSAEGVPVANLRGPIVGNRVTGVFRQVIPANAPELPLRHPLLPPPECSC